MPSNPFLTPGSGYGMPGGSIYDSPFVRDFLSQEVPQGEYETFLTGQGYGGFGRQAQFGRSLYGRSQSGHQGALMQNPTMSYRDYLNKHLGPGFIDNIWAGLTPQQRGETPNIFSGRSRFIGRG